MVRVAGSEVELFARRVGGGFGTAVRAVGVGRALLTLTARPAPLPFTFAIASFLPHLFTALPHLLAAFTQFRNVGVEDRLLLLGQQRTDLIVQHFAVGCRAGLTQVSHPLPRRLDSLAVSGIAGFVQLLLGFAEAHRVLGHVLLHRERRFLQHVADLVLLLVGQVDVPERGAHRLTRPALPPGSLLGLGAAFPARTDAGFRSLGAGTVAESAGHRAVGSAVPRTGPAKAVRPEALTAFHIVASGLTTLAALGVEPTMAGPIGGGLVCVNRRGVCLIRGLRSGRGLFDGF